MSFDIAKTHEELERKVFLLRDSGFSIGFVPTMGALHEGHLSLIKRALEKADRVVVSIYVNPTQFAPHEDFASYPRDLDSDIERIKAAGAHIVYTPSEADIYPDGPVTDLEAGEAAKGLETDFRPHFFDGVVTVVRTLFDQVQPDIAVFGEKDYQQLQVIREMNENLLLGVDVIGAPIIRDEYGLALSSRNAYLSEEELAIARKLNVVLKELAEEIRTYPKETDDLLPAGVQTLLAAGFDEVDYIDMRWGRLLAAAWVGKTRLIDNVEI
jgi:pantoate--beta-alanine ligase